MKIKKKSIKKLLERLEDMKPYSTRDAYDSGVKSGINASIMVINEMLNDYDKL